MPQSMRTRWRRRHQRVESLKALLVQPNAAEVSDVFSQRDAADIRRRLRELELLEKRALRAYSMRDHQKAEDLDAEYAEALEAIEAITAELLEAELPEGSESEDIEPGEWDVSAYARGGHVAGRVHPPVALDLTAQLSDLFEKFQRHLTDDRLWDTFDPDVFKDHHATTAFPIETPKDVLALRGRFVIEEHFAQGGKYVSLDHAPRNELLDAIHDAYERRMALLGRIRAGRSIAANPPHLIPRTQAVFDELMDQLEDGPFADLGEIGLICDPRAGEGGERQFAYCRSTPNTITIAFAPQAEQLDHSNIVGLMAHELGHAIDARFSPAELQRRIGPLDAGAERRADQIAEHAFGFTIRYDDKDVQCVGTRGRSPRPNYLAKNPWASDWKFEGVGGLIEQLEEAEPDATHVSLTSEPGEYIGHKVSWREGEFVVEVPVEHVAFTEGNQWNFHHAAALNRLIGQGERPVFDLPSARLWRITQEDVDESRAFYENDELGYQLLMEQPWEDSDAGTFHVLLLDGNHRALAAMAAGESSIFVTVGPNYREDVLDDEWVR